MHEEGEKAAIACAAELGKRGWKSRSVGIGRLDDLEADVRGFLESGAIGREHFDYLMGCWDFSGARAVPGAASLVIAACPSPARRLSFAYRGKSVAVLLPPVFAERGPFQEGAIAALDGVLVPLGHKAFPVKLPEKLLAARSGLARIGRNRIGYIEGMGSYARLAAFAVDLELGEEAWGEPRRPERCSDCGACERACPPGIIKDDGRPLPYDKCICYLNEETDTAFPDDIDPAWHNAAIGCMRCQENCPLDAPYAKAAAAGPSFDEEETRTVMEWKPGGDSGILPRALSRKLADCGLLRHLDKLPRNLGALFSKEGPR